MKKYRITCTEEQLRLIQQCVEDCHRFACGDVEMFHTIVDLDNARNIRATMGNYVKNYVTPELRHNECYSWDGYGCPNDKQRKFIAKTYPIYREILHFFAKDNKQWSAYASHTPTCEEGGQPIQIEEL